MSPRFILRGCAHESSRLARPLNFLLTSVSLASPRSGPRTAEPDWSRFRGPNGSGISTATNVPIEFGPQKNLLWRLPLPGGHSSPILFNDRIYLTAFRGDDARHARHRSAEGPDPLGAPRRRQVKTKIVDKRNNPASPSPAVEDNGVYVFFPDYGLIAYDGAGKERWTMPLGPFNNIYGMGASPVIVGDLVVLSPATRASGRTSWRVDKRTGKVQWKVDRPEAKSGHSTPILWKGPDGKNQILVPGSFLLTAYDAATGKKLWWVGGLSFEMKSTPVIGGDTIYVNGYGAPVNDPGNKVIDPRRRRGVEDGRRRRQRRDHQSRNFRSSRSRFWFDVADLDVNGSLTKDEWAYYRAALDSENGMLAIRLGGSGDMSDKAIRWKYQRSVPQLPSPLLYGGVLYMVNDNGIITTLNPDTGALIKQGRLTGAPGPHFASPTAADGHIFFTQRARRRRRRLAWRRSGADRGQRPRRRHLRDAGVCRRPHLRAHDASALRVRQSVGIVVRLKPDTTREVSCDRLAFRLLRSSCSFRRHGPASQSNRARRCFLAATPEVAGHLVASAPRVRRGSRAEARRPSQPHGRPPRPGRRGRMVGTLRGERAAHAVFAQQELHVDGCRPRDRRRQVERRGSRAEVLSRRSASRAERQPEGDARPRSPDDVDRTS